MEVDTLVLKILSLSRRPWRRGPAKKLWPKKVSSRKRRYASLHIYMYMCCISNLMRPFRADVACSSLIVIFEIWKAVVCATELGPPWLICILLHRYCICKPTEVLGLYIRILVWVILIVLSFFDSRKIWHFRSSHVSEYVRRSVKEWYLWSWKLSYNFLWHSGRHMCREKIITTVLLGCPGFTNFWNVPLFYQKKIWIKSCVKWSFDSFMFFKKRCTSNRLGVILA